MDALNDYRARARALMEAKQVGEAIQVLERAVACCEDDAEVTKELARLNLGINEVRAFQNWCHESMRIAPQDPEPHWMLAAYFRASGRMEEAEEEEQLAARLSSSGGRPA